MEGLDRELVRGRCGAESLEVFERFGENTILELCYYVRS